MVNHFCGSTWWRAFFRTFWNADKFTWPLFRNNYTSREKTTVCVASEVERSDRSALIYFDSLVSADGWTVARVPSLTHPIQFPGDGSDNTVLMGAFGSDKHKDIRFYCILLMGWFYVLLYMAFWVGPVWEQSVRSGRRTLQRVSGKFKAKLTAHAVLRRHRASSCCPGPRP